MATVDANLVGDQFPHDTPPLAPEILIDASDTQEGEMKDTQGIFPLMELPAELRLDILRACLRRPGKVLLSKPPPPPNPPFEDSAWGGLHSIRPGNHVSGTPPTTRRNRRNTIAFRRTLHPTRATPLPPAGVEEASPPRRAAAEDPLIVNILRTSKLVYKEGRDILYGENTFTLDTYTAVASLSALHQRSRRHIKHVEMEIPLYTEILESFSETVRLGLRYCTGLKRFVISMPFRIPANEIAALRPSQKNVSLYANAFDILRWLPQQCDVVLCGAPIPEIEIVVKQHLERASRQSKVSSGKAFSSNFSPSRLPARQSVPIRACTDCAHNGVLARLRSTSTLF